MAVNDWDTYWLNTRAGVAHKEGGPQDEVLSEFWLTLFKNVFPAMPLAPKMLDIACGNGAVERLALSALEILDHYIDLHISGLDESFTALMKMRKRYPLVAGIAGQAAHLPFQNENFDLVTSQFGVEYAGSEAFAEAARVIAPGGMLAMVLHLRGGGIYQECVLNLDAVKGFRDCNLLGHLEAIFRTALAVQQGRKNRDMFRLADEQFARSVAGVEQVMQRCGKHVADGMLFRIYTDIAQMYRRFKSYEPGEVFNWIALMSRELDSYTGRMLSMSGVALDSAQMDQVIAQLKDLDFIIQRYEILHMGRPSMPAAWVVIAEKQKRRGVSW